MFSHDRAIEKSVDDLLGRKDFAERLAETISRYKSSESLVIALNGNWGSGKSSVINMVKEQCIEKYAQNIKVIDFNPWFYTDKHNLIFKFFALLLGTLRLNDGKQKQKALFQHLKKYAENFEGPLSLISSRFELLTKFIKSFLGRKINKLDSELTSIEYQRDQLREEFLKLDFKFLVVIDDIDRLRGDEIRDIFQLVKLVGDIPNIIYFLSFDQSIVSKVMDKFQESKGEAYIEKIVQVPFNLPPPSKQKMEEYLLKKINAVIKESTAEENRWNELYREGIRFVFKTLRDVNRYINILAFDYSLLEGEVNIVDLLGITIIKVFQPGLYDVIKNNKSLFLKVSAQDRHSTLRSMNETNYKDELNSLATTLQLSESFKKILLELFPETSIAFADIYYSKTQLNSRESRLKQRISSEDCFDTYFMLAVPSEYLSNTQMKVILDMKDKDLLKSKLIELNKERTILYFLDRLIDYINDIPFENAKFIIKILFDIADTFDDGSPVYGRYEIEFQIWAFTVEILKKMSTPHERFIFLQDIISNASDSLLQSVYEISHHDTQANRFDRSGDGPKHKLLEDSDLDKLEKLGKEKIELWAKANKLIYAKRLAFILARWEEWGGKTDLTAFVEKCYQSIPWIIRLIQSEMKRVSNQSYEGYEQSYSYELYYSEILKKYDVSLIYKELEKIEEAEFKNLSEEDREAVRLFRGHYKGTIINRR